MSNEFIFWTASAVLFVLLTVFDWIEYKQIVVADIVVNAVVSFIPILNCVVVLNYTIELIGYLGVKFVDSNWWSRFKKAWINTMTKVIIKKKEVE